MTEEKTSEYGKGFVYNLILFAKHWMMKSDKKEYWEKQGTPNKFYQLWFDGSSDHLYDIQIPKIFKGTEIEIMVKELKNTALEIGHGISLKNNGTEKDFKRVFELTEKIALEVDKYFEVDSIKADYK